MKLLLTLALAATTAVVKSQGEGEVEYCISRPEGDRCYNIYAPDNLIGSPALLLEFHSTFGSKDDQGFLTDYNDIADERGDFIIARPEAFGDQRTFRAGYCCGTPGVNDEVDDIAFFVEMIEETIGNYNVDRRRIYAAGYSQGGAVSHYLAYTLPQYIAAISTNAFALSPEYFNEAKDRKNRGDPFHPVPVLSIHGYNDRLYCWDFFCPTVAIFFLGTYFNARSGFGNWAELNGCSGDPVTRSEKPSSWIPLINTEDHDDHQWIKAYRNCDGGVRVVQYLNSRNHSGEFIGKNGVNNQKTYSRRIIEFLMRWELPENFNTRVSNALAPSGGEDPDQVSFTLNDVGTP